MRADAARNRAAILATTADLLTTVGPDLTIESVAELAGVGVGTIYRHFPDRNALIREVIAGQLATIGDLVHACAAVSEHDPVAAWTELFEGFLASGFGHLLPALMPLAQRPEFFVAESVAARAAIFASAQTVLANAQRAGAVREDVSLVEVVLLVAAVTHAPPSLPADLARQLIERHGALIASSLRPDPTSTLPGTALSAETMFEIFSPPADRQPR